MRKYYLYLALVAAAVTAASVAYAQQITGKNAGAVLNIAAFDRIVDDVRVNLNAFLNCSGQGLLLQDSDCVLVPPPERQWVDAAGVPAGGPADETPGAVSDIYAFIRFHNPSEAPASEEPLPVWGTPSANLTGPAGPNGTHCYTNKAPAC